MPFVHGHPRDAGWVVSHYRRPQRAGSEQLDLDEATTDPDLDAAVPGPRPTSENDEDDPGAAGPGLSGAARPP